MNPATSADVAVVQRLLWLYGKIDYRFFLPGTIPGIHLKVNCRFLATLWNTLPTTVVTVTQQVKLVYGIMVMAFRKTPNADQLLA